MFSLDVIFWKYQTLICLFDAGKKFQKYYPKWCFDGDLPWYNQQKSP